MDRNLGWEETRTGRRSECYWAPEKCYLSLGSQSRSRNFFFWMVKWWSSVKSLSLRSPQCCHWITQKSDWDFSDTFVCAQAELYHSYIFTSHFHILLGFAFALFLCFCGFCLSRILHNKILLSYVCQTVCVSQAWHLSFSPLCKTLNHSQAYFLKGTDTRTIPHLSPAPQAVPV